MDHEHTIGVWNDYDNTQLVTLSELKKVFKNDFDFSCWAYYENKGEPVPECIAKTRPSFDKKWKNHFDWRCNTNLTRFTHCPFCGETLDWSEMKKEKWEDETE